ncbi:hypothetical protein, partial [Flavobacterium zhairuonense]|uniref:hypothetical protein n=1 Tax=Flavobacterium zhairuonense TaxID=2493631 RepID=UPI001ABFAEDA
LFQKFRRNESYCRAGLQSSLDNDKIKFAFHKINNPTDFRNLSGFHLEAGLVLDPFLKSLAP